MLENCILYLWSKMPDRNISRRRLVNYILLTCYYHAHPEEFEQFQYNPNKLPILGEKQQQITPTKLSTVPDGKALIHKIANCDYPIFLQKLNGTLYRLEREGYLLLETSVNTVNTIRIKSVTFRKSAHLSVQIEETIIPVLEAMYETFFNSMASQVIFLNKMPTIFKEQAGQCSSSTMDFEEVNSQTVEKGWGSLDKPASNMKGPFKWQIYPFFNEFIIYSPEQKKKTRAGEEEVEVGSSKGSIKFILN